MDPLKFGLGIAMIIGALLSVPTRTRRVGRVISFVVGMAIVFVLLLT